MSVKSIFDYHLLFFINVLYLCLHFQVKTTRSLASGCIYILICRKLCLQDYSEEHNRQLCTMNHYIRKNDVPKIFQSNHGYFDRGLLLLRTLNYDFLVQLYERFMNAPHSWFYHFDWSCMQRGCCLPVVVTFEIPSFSICNLDMSSYSVDHLWATLLTNSNSTTMWKIWVTRVS